MKVKILFPGTIYIVIVIVVLVSLTNCGPDESAPDIDTSFIPQTVFFNDTGSTEYYLFQGRATDNTNVDSVEVSGDNGANWQAAVINNDPPNENWDVQWSYLASSGVLSAGMHTVLVRAADRDSNETISAPLTLESHFGSTTSSLNDVFTAASSGDMIGLSTGVGKAYGGDGTALTIPITVNLTILGSGYGDMLTSGTLSPIGNSVATILDAGPATASLFSLNANLNLWSLRLLGGVHGIHISDSGGSDPQLYVKDCLFDRQGGWSVYAKDDNRAVNVQITSSVVDAYSATNSTRGGLYLENINYLVEGSEFYNQTDPDGLGGSTVQGAAVLAVGGAGKITQSDFSENSLSIWANGGSPVISSNHLGVSAPSTNGIDISGASGTPLINYNTITDHSGVAVRVRGSMTPKFYWNNISIDTLTYPQARGIVVLDPDSLPEFGKFPYSDSGCNRFESREAVVVDFVLEVDSTTGTDDVFYAAQNFWGTQFSTGPLVYTYKIHDGTDNDNGGAAIVDLTGTPGGTNPIIWNGERACP